MFSFSFSRLYRERMRQISRMVKAPKISPPATAIRMKAEKTTERCKTDCRKRLGFGSRIP